jgi:serine/threonine protein kinase
MLVDTENAREVVKVVDFGIAKLMPSSGKQSQNLTQTGEIFGSPIYMSPEQCQGMPLDARSDIYSCGVMMYEALTGLPPLMGETIVDTMQMHVASRPHPFAEVRPDLYIPTPLEQVVFRSLEKHPDSRFQSMEELKEILEHVQRKLAGANIQLESTANRQAVQQQRENRSTRPHMSASYAPNQLPRPMLDVPPQREPERLDMQTQSQSQSSYRRRQQEESQSQSSYRRRNSETGSRASAQGMSVFKVEEPDAEEDDDGDKQTMKIGWMIPVSIVMIIAAVLGIIALVVTHSH